MGLPSTLAASLLLLKLLSSRSAPASAEEKLTSFSASHSPWHPSQKNQFLISPNASFLAGFRRSPRSASLFVFAVWVRPAADQTIVWSLDRDVDHSATLAVSPLGVLTLNDSSGRNLWPGSARGSNGTRLVLNDDGSLVFGGWTSFSSPTDTILPNQPIPTNGTALRSGQYRFVNSTTLVFGQNDSCWSSKDGAIKSLNSSGVLLLSNGNNQLPADIGRNSLRRLTLDKDGNLRVYSLDKSGQWVMVWQAVQELCTIHGFCGPNTICIPTGSNATTCVCPPGFVNSTDGRACNRETSFVNKTSKFLRLDYVSFDQGFHTINLSSLPFEICQSRCLANHSCIGFSYKFDGSLYCVHHVDFLAHGYWSPVTETALFLRVASSETKVSNFTGMTSMADAVCPLNINLASLPKRYKDTKADLAIMITCFVLELIVGVLSFWAFLRKYATHRDMTRAFGLEFLPAGGLQSFTYAELKAATNDFSEVIGSGGFGVAYKGELPDHRVIAVKRLKDVGRREAEFRAELTIIARMHHLNLVRMWGFCAEKEQRMLVYEFIPNGSLSKFLFSNPEKVLDWSTRYRIAVGVARAIAYLHEECLEWVLHCDIKPENILLEDDFCPKVSDFGLAKLSNKEDNVSVSQMRGTRGYMAPEWTIWSEPITAKADVYSFGMVLLEIVTGLRNFDFQQLSVESHEWYFPGWAFEKVYVEQKVEEILDRRIMERYDNRMHAVMVERMVRTAMWCLQERAEARPSMGKVVKMLEGAVEITEPEKPTILSGAGESNSLLP